MMRNEFLVNTIYNHGNLKKVLGLLKSLNKSKKLNLICQMCENLNIEEDEETLRIFLNELNHISNDESVNSKLSENNRGGGSAVDNQSSVSLMNIGKHIGIVNRCNNNLLIDSNNNLYEEGKDLSGSLSNSSEEINEFDIDMNTATNEKNKATRIYVDGIFDLSHSGHFNAMRQAKELGDVVVVGINSDEDALNSKGVMPIYTQEERGALIAGCKWVDEVIIGTKYNVSMELLGKYNCDYAAHGSDIAYDRNGNCCYEEVRKNNRLKIFERSYGISTTTIINHLLQAVSSSNKSLSDGDAPTGVVVNNMSISVPSGGGGVSNTNLPSTKGTSAKTVSGYEDDKASPSKSNGKCLNGIGEKSNLSKKSKTNSKEFEEENTVMEATTMADNKIRPSESMSSLKHALSKNKCYVTASQLYQFMGNHEKKNKKKVVYVDGSFDIFHIGHLKILENAKKLGDYLIVGMHSDEVVRKMKGKYFPVVSLLERTLNVLAMKVVDDVVIGAPWLISESFIKRFQIDVVVRGTVVDYFYSSNELDPYAIPKKLNIYQELSSESGITTFEIIERIEKNKNCLMSTISKRKKKEDNIWKVNNTYVLN
ncbi:ethanolamine-phosphate cytidylyltransferase, putative [Plasmodium knowlesi strain H]|uniref:ethanolamine-phosphate cytidylyltransferase n=3 Tax=Plasmodium knowlesi TaxID=5850 RepID=A0A5K1VQ15_PLAKH|nr:ethanolamine-phosphate cytidylyltransferase, putative [Plasmodium knowlesi strain H]OTN66215.1 putative Ethanolamine-phosphate cytidylyltransferase [Plasmodium knowlesi]CAA9989857.1 ethanolamine-phosphate cytidylyltransferase, putative [Plasmodium knowlesi strain H]SBO24411.1 ethanolamine-phosphate cytidylyltransferase, putative [Plasmodium knowlesi strain H]SBO26596.1 ethanolamine-phosphate cytidylyltransferase, putative [Plasmodium knowlesi strain H]VVS79331.1 ethanolamine-phosphate cytid|eukprot:XP_002259872.1 ethanolamine-phosphate cytidylyltransferase,putative [Plasmodium knowlesi strain H]